MQKTKAATQISGLYGEKKSIDFHGYDSNTKFFLIYVNQVAQRQSI